ncbi:ABC transporter substrate-binding protein [Kitasatospora kazusensis]|uniref:ABC transporter substrate-binding protein n=1 Tax=Kitasatospora kazusensis TaxID=407974 RepID=A0ABN2YSR1_9ACTN
MHGTTLPTGRTARSCAALATGSLLLTACAGSPAPANSVADLHGRLPGSIRSAGVLRIASDPSYAPVESKAPNGAMIGLDPDIGAELGKRLGVRVEFVDTPFDKLIPGLQAQQYDAVMSAMTDDGQRRDGTDDSGRKTNPGVDFVDYFIAGTSILVAKGNPNGIKSLDDLCGTTIALQRATTQATLAAHQSDACNRAGKPLTVQQFDTDDQALAALSAGQAVADLNDFPVAAYDAQNVQGGNAFQVATAQLQPGPYGIAVAKGGGALEEVLVKALDQVIRSGDYEKILAKWNLSAGAAENAVINGGF